MKSIYLKRLSSVLLLVGWMAVIFYLSSQSAAESSELSRGLVYKTFCTFYPYFEEFSQAKQLEIISNMTFPVRKAAHFSEYALLAVFAVNAVRWYDWKSLKVRNTTAFLMCVIYSVSDEIHQSFVPGRACRLLDVIIDSTGALVAIALILLFEKRRKRNG